MRPITTEQPRNEKPPDEAGGWSGARAVRGKGKSWFATSQDAGDCISDCVDRIDAQRLIHFFRFGKIFSIRVSILCVTSVGMVMVRPHSRLVSPGHLLVASRPILPPRPLMGEAKSR